LQTHNAAVLQAPPGAGKTTRVPLALLHEPWLGGQKLVMLEPRRLAARAAARYMAALIHEDVGQTVGYRVRLDSRVGAKTRVEVVTEGVLTRMVQEDPTLAGVGLVIFDEFHERSLNADLGLALTLETQSLVRPDVRILVMSATLDAGPVAALLGDAPIITSEGRSFPVETMYVEPRDRRVEDVVAATIERTLGMDDGDVLVFLPGAGEIRRVEERLTERPHDGTQILPLHGNLAADAQDRAIRPSAPGERKVVLATSIAETSLTIEGVRVVIDSGLARVPRFSPRTGMTRLDTVRVSRASADQRRGRAGRVAAGVCYRLWPEHETASLIARATPEILEADLAPFVLDLAGAGVRSAPDLRWLDEPPPAALAQARELLLELEAIDRDGRLTEHGRRMSRLALHPRLAHMVLSAATPALAALACDVAALLAERDVLRAEGQPPDADLRLRLDLVRGDHADARAFHGAVVDRDALRRVRAERDRLRRSMRLERVHPASPDEAGLLVALAYPDRIAQRRSGEAARFLLRNGRGAALIGAQALATADYLAIATIDDQRPESRIWLAASITLAEIVERFGDQITTERIVEWSDSGGILARERERLGTLVLHDAPLRDVDGDTVAQAIATEIRQRGLSFLPRIDDAHGLRQRLAFARTIDASLPDLSDSTLLDSLDEWLVPHLHRVRRRDDLARLDVQSLLLSRLSWHDRQRLDDLAPTHLEVPSGSRIPIDYSKPEAPSLAVRLQEMFGLAESPRVGGGRVPLTLNLLSPAHRPVQVTRDLASFWQTSYFDVRKDLRGRYPKHYWPDDPLIAEATRRAKPRRS
jgi:ATP-dependent RNA helicase HrpB